MHIRQATSDELPAVSNVVDGANLATDIDRIKRCIDDGTVFVALNDASEDGARNPSSSNPANGQILGVLILDGDEITAVAVRRRRRAQGIGTALVETASVRRERLVAEFDEGVRSFWESLGFDIEKLDESGRYRGCLDHAGQMSG